MSPSRCGPAGVAQQVSPSSRRPFTYQVRGCRKFCMFSVPHNGYVSCLRSHFGSRVWFSRCSSSDVAMAIAYVYNLSFHWMIRQTERPIRAGMKALILRHYIIIARMLNRSFRDMVDSLPAYMLLKQVVSEEGRYRMVGQIPHGFPGECERVVHLLQRFQRSYLPKQTTQESRCWSLSHASVSYDGHGAIKEISYGMMVMVQESWVRIWNQTSDIRGKTPRRSFATSMAGFLIYNRRAPDRNLIPIVNRCSRSIPRIASTKSQSRRKTRSASPELIRYLRGDN